MSYLIQHTRLGFCWLDLVALIVLIAVAVITYRKGRGMKKEEKDLVETLSAMYEAETAEPQKQ